jgi:membrane-bound metal-dependent hydrolase YbcI (DUF457 family)
MAQIGLHGVVSLVIRKWIPARGWLMLGVVLGSLIPDLDNVAVAIATVTRQSTVGLHRTATHSVFAAAAFIIIFYLVARISRQPRWSNLGWGLGLGMLIHILLDLLIWFNGVALFWPLPIWINLWANIHPPALWMKLMDPAELLFLALFFFLLVSAAGKHNTDESYIKTLRTWMFIQAGLFIIFTGMTFILSKGFQTIFGAVYLLSLFLSIGVTIRMRKTIEAA